MKYRRIEQPGNGGVVELGQSSLFAGEALAAGRGEPGVPEDFDGGLTPKIVPDPEIDDPHPAFAEHSKNPIGAEPSRRRGGA